MTEIVVGQTPEVGPTPPEPPANAGLPATSGDGGTATETPDFATYDFVRFPDGTLRAVPKSVVTASQNASTLPVVDEGPAQYFLWLSNGDVETVDAAQVPGPAGAQSPHGYWEKNGMVYDVVGCYAVPTPR